MKRKNPYAEEEYRSSKNDKIDLKFIYEKTLSILATGARKQELIVEEESSEKRSCPICTKYSDSNKFITCRDCFAYVCSSCRQACDKCCLDFCTLCSIKNYDNREERTFCLNCNVLVEKEGE